MTRALTSAMQSASAGSGRPQVLVVISQSVPGIARTYRLALRAGTIGGGTYTISGVEYSAILASMPRIEHVLPKFAGVGRISGGSVAVVNPDNSATPWSDLLDDGALDAAELEFSAVWITGSETSADIIGLGSGIVDGESHDFERMTLGWYDAAIRKFCRWPTQGFDFSDYPNANAGLWGTIKPVLLGDLTGQAFDVATPADAGWRHVPCPLTDGMTQDYFVRDTGTANDQEDLIRLQGVTCEIPSGSRTLSGEAMTLDDNEVHAWVSPIRENAATSGCTNMRGARTDDLDDYCTVGASDTLAVDMAGLPSSLGRLGAADSLVASDVEIHVVYTDNSGVDAPLSLSILADGSGITGHTSVSLSGAGTPDVNTQQIGDHISSWDDLTGITAKVEEVDGGDGGWVHRILMKVVFRSTETLSAWDEQKVFRSQRGFIEDAASATNDYQDGEYVQPSGRTTTPFENPADQVEVILRNKDWGLGLRAPNWVEDTNVLDGAIGNGTTWTVDYDAGTFNAGDVVLCDDEVVLVTAESDPDLTVIRGYAGSRIACHADASALYVMGTDGQVDVGSFRGAAGILQHPTGDEVVTNGEMEGSYSGGVAPSWSENDPDTKITPASAAGYARRYGQQLIRTVSGGSSLTGVKQTLTLTSGTRYLATLWATGGDGDTMNVLIGSGTDWSEWELTGTGEWEYIEIPFTAWATSLDIILGAGEAAGDVVSYDEVSVRALASWEWAFAVTDERDSRAWFDDALTDCGMRLIEDSSGRTAARAWSPHATPVEAWDDSDIVLDVDGGSVPVRVSRSSADDLATSVEVRYGWDHLLGRYRSNVYVGCEWESTREEVSAVSDTGSAGVIEITVADTTNILPSGEYSLASGGTVTTSGNTLTSSSSTFQTDGTSAGDWVLVFYEGVTSDQHTTLTVIDSVDSETQLTVRDTLPTLTLSSYWRVVTTMPFLIGVGGIAGLPISSTSTTLEICANMESRTSWWGQTSPGISFPTGADASYVEVGDVVWELISDSEDRSDPDGYRDQVETLRDNRERQAAVRLASLGQERPLVHECPRVHDRETAVAIRNLLFDQHRRRWEISLSTSLATIDREIGDVVTVEHTLVPGGTMDCEIVRQVVDASKGIVEYGLRG